MNNFGPTIRTIRGSENRKKPLAPTGSFPLGRFGCACRRNALFAFLAMPPEKIENASPVCYADESEAQIFEGMCQGKIIFEPRGQNGFGYDPLFVPNGFEKTFAELGDVIKNKISHRAQALEKLKAFFMQQNTETAKI